jgi:hypothetical protein
VLLIALGHRLGGAALAGNLLEGADTTALTAAQRAVLVPALVPAFHLVFAIAALIAAASAVATLFLKELPLRTTPRAGAAASR